MFLTLHDGEKFRRVTFVLLRSKASDQYDKRGGLKRQWIVTLPKGQGEVAWGEGGKEGEEHGRSVLSSYGAYSIDSSQAHAGRGVRFVFVR